MTYLRRMVLDRIAYTSHFTFVMISWFNKLIIIWLFISFSSLRHICYVLKRPILSNNNIQIIAKVSHRFYILILTVSCTWSTRYNTRPRNRWLPRYLRYNIKNDICTAIKSMLTYDQLSTYSYRKVIRLRCSYMLLNYEVTGVAYQ